MSEKRSSLHGSGSLLMRLMLADSRCGRSLLASRASGLGHYSHLTKDTRIEKRGTRLELSPPNVASSLRHKSVLWP